MSLSVWNNIQSLAKCFTPKSWKCTVLGCPTISAGGRRNNWIMSFHQKMSSSLPEQAHLPTALWQPSNPALECQSTCLGDKHRTCSSQWLCACIFTFGSLGLGFLSRLSLEWVKGEIVPSQNLVLKITFFFETNSTYLCAGLLVLEIREPCITKPRPAKLLPGLHLSFIDSVIPCYGLNCTSPPYKKKVLNS